MIDRKEIYLAAACFFAGITLVGAFNGCLFTTASEEIPGLLAPGHWGTPPGQTIPSPSTVYPYYAGYNPGVYFYVYPSKLPQPGQPLGYRGHAGAWDPQLGEPLPGDILKAPAQPVGVEAP